MSTPNEATWNDAIARCVEGLISPEELSTMLMRIDLPDEGRRAINDALDSFHGEIPMPGGARARLLARLGKGDDSTDDGHALDADGSAVGTGNDSLTSMQFPRYPADEPVMRDVLGESQETPPPADTGHTPPTDAKSEEFDGDEAK